MRILFHGPSTSSTRPKVKLSCETGFNSTKYVKSIKELRSAFNLTGNTGNMIHAEAPLKFLDYKVSHSAVMDIHMLYTSYTNKNSFFQDVNKNFDAIVLSMANFIRPDFNTNLYEVLENIEIPLYVLGSGLQKDVSLHALHPNTQKLLELFNRKAKLFGCRGHISESWLHKNGFLNAVALGCPSLYVYPKEILKEKVYKNEKITNVITAGHLQNSHLLKHDKRIKTIYKIMNSFEKVSYVFQDEPFTYKELLDFDGELWEESISEFNKDILNSYLSIKLNKNVDFSNYYFFFNTDYWRGVCSKHQLYLGDRLHAGIAAHQAGIKSIILFEEKRVEELAIFYNFPAMSLDDFMEQDIDYILKNKLSAEKVMLFEKTYCERYNHFVSVLEKVGLKFKYKIDVDKLRKDKKEKTKLSSIDRKAEFLKNTLNDDGGMILYCTYLFSLGRANEALNSLKERIEFSKTSISLKLYFIEKGLENQYTYDYNSILETFSTLKLDRHEHRLVSRILKLANSSKILSSDLIYNIINREENDSFDECILYLSNSIYKNKVLLKLIDKIHAGYGTRIRIKIAMDMLIKSGKVIEAKTLLLDYGTFLSDEMKSNYSKKLV